MAERIYQRLARAFAAEGVDTHFTLMGDGNMHWATTLASQGARTFHVRHEHCACAMAMGYSIASGNVGVASVTCGPGLTQIMTALATAVRAEIPLVVFAGESPIGAAWFNQQIDQAPFVAAAGARYIALHNPAQMFNQVQEAFLHARQNRQPVVIGVPFDLQQKPYEANAPAEYVPSTAVLPIVGRMMPDPIFVEQAAAMIAQAKNVIVLAGRGAVRSLAASECEALAVATGGLLATTLPVRGLFDHDAFSIGIGGGFATDVARECFLEADLIVAVGASLTQHTVDAGRLYPNARVIQVDSRPVGVKQGRKTADLYVQADAKAGLSAILTDLETRDVKPGDWRTPELARRIRDEPADKAAFAISDNSLDPRDAVAALDKLLPKHWEMVNGSGHSSYFSAQMRGRKAKNFHTIREFGAIGNGLAYAMGVAAARPDNVVVVIDGDGGLLMHAQELETIQRHGLRILICALNDGAYGSEIHKLQADGLSDEGAVFGRGDLGAVARGFGLRGGVVRKVEDFDGLLDGFLSADKAELWDIHISAEVTSPVMRKAHPKKH